MVACVCVRVLGIDGVLSPCHHGDKRSLTARGERLTAFISIILTYISVCERVYACVFVCVYVEGLGKGITLESKINQCHVVS